MTFEFVPFGCEYEVILRPVRRRFGCDDRLVLEADPGGRALLIEDFGVFAAFNSPEFGEVLDEQVIVRAFASADERDAYLEERYVADRSWRRERIDEARRGAGL